MFQMISLVVIYGVMMFIWTFVYLNRSHDKVNQSFLAFLSNILVWMVLNNLNDNGDGTVVTLAVKTVYWLSMMYLSITFLYFIYRLLKRKLDWLFFAALALNTAMVVLRYCYPIDYTDPTFWRMDDPVVAPIMSLSFSLPAIYALYLVLRQMITIREKRQRAQLSYILYGIGIALVVSVFSEYILPAVFHVDEKLYLMHSAIAIFVVAIFVSIMRYRLLNLRSDYIYRSLFLNAGEGILIVNRTGRIVSVNRVGRELLQDENLDAGDVVSDYIPDYRFDTDYCQHEFTSTVNGQKRALSMTQYPIDELEHDTTKLLVLSDLTQTHQRLEREKEELLEKTIVDELTGLYNKQFLREKYLIDNREAVHTALMFIDVDDFKTINDTYGHLVGDEVLKELAACIKNNLRVANDAIRFGGDEFLVVLEQVGLEEAYRIAERLRDCAAELEFSGGDTRFHITLSIGLIEGTAPLTVLLEKADRAMYASKSKGKNKTTVFTEDETDGAFHMTLS
ncbi:MAG: GGDEF domain-containing protein [Firmicutes bacterium HGW-Firmicutes-9]|jgi:diguanylate cyclase (GGDEF)-like protein|nr:MAG: GGDEF domain-containing protein [Firmicutes bacterium HGW-Firmicutes-9]